MRYYLVNKTENEEVVFNLIESTSVSANKMYFHYEVYQEEKLIDQKRVYICKRAGRYFSSFDDKRWTKIPRQIIPRHIVNVDREFFLYRGFKPSGLESHAGAGLVSQMPGKISEIYVQIGDQVQEGDKLLVLEAMKMENIIRSNVCGVVKSINIKVGDTIDKGILMIDIERETL